jgi:DNA replication and repair protein RecF
LALKTLRATDFRCLAAIEASFDARVNLITGPNAAGKTSVLEAIAYLGRGKSFRGAGLDKLVRHGHEEFVLYGELEDRHGRVGRIGVRNGRSGLETSVNGDSSGGLVALANALPVQVIDPDVHNLVAGVPDERRRFLDWLGFHVEHGYLEQWRRYRKALRQRNAALKTGARPAVLDIWDRELAVAAEPLSEMRRRIVGIAAPVIETLAAQLLEASVSAVMHPGWSGEDAAFAEVLRENRQRDLRLGTSGSGPHRADLRLRYDERQARKLVSRGQQKLLACSLVLAGVRVTQSAADRPMLLLLDDPAAELDGSSLSRLMRAVEGLECQVIATALDPEAALFQTPPRLFHVEQGVLTNA